MCSSTIIENLLESSQGDTSTALAYYYFDFSEAEKRTIDSFIRSLIVQLTANLPEIPQVLANLYTRSQEENREPSTDGLKGALRNLLRESAKTTAVVDALDECSEPEELIQFLGEMRSLGTTALRLLVVSRQHFEGADTLEELKPVHISIQDEAANDDILRFVQEILNKDLKLRHWPVQVKNKIETALVSKSSGM